MRDAGEEVEGGGVEVCSVESVKGVRQCRRCQTM